MAETGMKFDEHAEEEEEKPDEKTKKKGKKAKVEEIDPEELERRKAAAAKAKDIATFGVSLVMRIYQCCVAYLDLGRLSRGQGRAAQLMDVWRERNQKH